jgi:hypothetical protein
MHTHLYTVMLISIKMIVYYIYTLCLISVNILYDFNMILYIQIYFRVMGWSHVSISPIVGQNKMFCFYFNVLIYLLSGCCFFCSVMIHLYINYNDEHIDFKHRCYLTLWILHIKKFFYLNYANIMSVMMIQWYSKLLILYSKYVVECVIQWA